MVHFGELLAELRQDKKLTQRDLARILFVSAGTISNYEKGQHFPDVEKLIALADYFHVTTDYLLGRSDSNLSPDVFSEQLTPNETVGSAIHQLTQMSMERKKALLLIMHDMGQCTLIERYGKKENS